MDVKNATPVDPDTNTDYVLVHRRPADFDAMDPLKIGSIELVAISALGTVGGAIGTDLDGGGAADAGTSLLDGGTP